MINVPWDKPTRRIGAPGNWDHAASGLCHTIEVVDQQLPSGEEGRVFNVMYTVWMPTPEELELLSRGQPIMLGIFGTQHPVISLSVPANAIEQGETR